MFRVGYESEMPAASQKNWGSRHRDATALWPNRSVGRASITVLMRISSGLRGASSWAWPLVPFRLSLVISTKPEPEILRELLL